MAETVKKSKRMAIFFILGYNAKSTYILQREKNILSFTNNYNKFYLKALSLL
jgi:hypothetical protein